jgi:hypothetical protein
VAGDFFCLTFCTFVVFERSVLVLYIFGLSVCQNTDLDSEGGGGDGRIDRSMKLDR